MQAGLAEIQKNIGLLANLTEPLQVVDKRRKRIIATIYPTLKSNQSQRLAGKYRDQIPEHLKGMSFAEERETAMLIAMKEKYGFAD